MPTRMSAPRQPVPNLARMGMRQLDAVAHAIDIGGADRRAGWELNQPTAEVVGVRQAVDVAGQFVAVGALR